MLICIILRILYLFICLLCKSSYLSVIEYIIHTYQLPCKQRQNISKYDHNGQWGQSFFSTHFISSIKRWNKAWTRKYDEKGPASTVSTTKQVGSQQVTSGSYFLKPFLCHFGFEISHLTLYPTTKEFKESLAHRCNFKKWKNPLLHTAASLHNSIRHPSK